MADINLVTFFMEIPPEIKMRSRSCAEKRVAPIAATQTSLYLTKVCEKEHAFLPR